MPKSDTGAAAVDYIKRGLAVIALHPHKKNPSFANGLKDATTCAEDIAQWYESYPDDNVAIVTGEVSGNIGVIDVDIDPESDKDGFDFLRQWEKEHGELPETWTVKTARGGSHLYYRFKGDVPRNSSNQEIGIDFRGEGGYVMAPPSIHPNGNRVEWDIAPDDADLAWADDNVLAFVESIGARTGPSERFELPMRIEQGGRDWTIFRYACSLQSAGRPDWEIKTLVHGANKSLCSPPLPDEQVEQKISSALGYAKGKPIDLNALERPSERVQLELTIRGNPKDTVDNRMRILEDDPDVKDHFVYDESAYTKMKRLPLPWEQGTGYERMRDTDYVQIQRFIETKYGLTGKQPVKDAVEAVAYGNKVNPKKDWLSTLVWDGEDRISTLAACALGCDPTSYNCQVIRLFLYGCVARIFQPGCKFDYMLVLYGPQGIGKSTFVRRLATRAEWYLDNMSDFGGDESINKIRGKWIVEIAELQAFSRRDVNQIKAYCTQQYDDIRPKYGTETEQRPRQCCFVGTTNSHDFLSDKTGNRRFLILDCGIHEISLDMFDDSCEEYFEQCWAQAYAEWSQLKPPLVMPDGLVYEAERQRSEFMADDPRVGMIESYLEAQRQLHGDDTRVCIAQIAEDALGIPREVYSGNTRLSREIAEILSNEIVGWERAGQARIREYGKQRCWKPKPDSKSIEVGELGTVEVL